MFDLYKNKLFLIFLIFPIGIYFLKLNNSQDREAYYRHFSEPFGDDRIERGFQFYMAFFDYFSITPFISILITCVIIYLLFCIAWVNISKDQTLSSFLFFNAIAWSVMNYYTVSSLRMGLAISLALALISFYESVYKKSIYIVLAFFMHYGVVLFVFSVWLMSSVNSFCTKKQVFLIFSCFLFSFLFYEVLIYYHLIPEYYLQFFLDPSVLSSRQLPYTIIFSFFCFFIQLFCLGSSYILGFYNRLSLLSFFFVVYYFYTWNPLFGKMMMPFVFIQGVWLYVFIKNNFFSFLTGSLLKYILLCFFNLTSFFYVYFS